MRHAPHILGWTRSGRPIPVICGGNGSDEGDGVGDGTSDGGGGEGSQLNEHGYPDNTPVADMPADQQAAYWRYHARKHETTAKARGDYDDLKAKADELEKLKREQMQPDEKALAEARDQAAKDAETKIRSEYAAKLVDAEIKAASAGRMDDTQREVLLDGLDRTRFLTEAGDVDTDKVTAYVNAIAPAGEKRATDLGQGRRDGKPAGGVSAGADRYAERHRKN